MQKPSDVVHKGAGLLRRQAFQARLLPEWYRPLGGGGASSLRSALLFPVLLLVVLACYSAAICSIEHEQSNIFVQSAGQELLSEFEGSSTCRNKRTLPSERAIIFFVVDRFRVGSSTAYLVDNSSAARREIKIICRFASSGRIIAAVDARRQSLGPDTSLVLVERKSILRWMLDHEEAPGGRG